MMLAKCKHRRRRIRNALTGPFRNFDTYRYQAEKLVKRLPEKASPGVVEQRKIYTYLATMEHSLADLHLAVAVGHVLFLPPICLASKP